MDAFKLKDGFILGVANSSLGTEGKNKRGSWYNWFKEGRIRDNANPNVASDHYELYKEDFLLMQKMGITHCRFGISWSRIEPVKGIFNIGELDHYVQMLECMSSHGIIPMLTVMENDLPMWFLAEGGFENDGCEKIFIHYVRKVAETLGKSVKEFITFDEPNLYAINSYFYGSWPPGKRSTKSWAKVLGGIAKCHIAAYETIHEICGDVKVGCAVNMRVFEPKDEKSFYQRNCAIKMENYFQNALIKAVTFGEAQKPLKNFGKTKGNYCDFWALSYYTRSTVSGLSDGTKEGAAVDDLGQEIYPKGIVECAEKLYKLKAMPIYITSNGVCDNEDSFRIKYICEHLKAVIESELPIERYYYRNFIDGFEGLEGESAKFGIVKTDFRTQKRSVKRSGEFYSELIANNALTDEMDAKYSPEQFYKNSKGESLDKINEMFFDMDKALSTELGEGVVTKVSQYVEAPEIYDEKRVRAEESKAHEEANVTETAEIAKYSESLSETVCADKDSPALTEESEAILPKEEKTVSVNDISSFSAAAAKEAIAKAVGINSEAEEAETVMDEIAREMKEEGSEYSNFEALLNAAVVQAEENAQDNECKNISENTEPETLDIPKDEAENVNSEVRENSSKEENVGDVLDSILKKENIQPQPESVENYGVFENEDDSFDYAVREVSEEKESVEPEQTVPEETEKKQVEEEVLLDDDDYIDMFLN